MKALICAVVVALGTFAVAAEETKLGAGVTLKDATPIAALVDKPADYLGKTVRVDGVATAVCEMMGCWIAISEDGSKDAKAVRIKVEDGQITIPVTAKGKKVSAEGVFEKVADEHGEEAAAEHAKQTANAKPDSIAKFQIKGTGLVIR